MSHFITRGRSRFRRFDRFGRFHTIYYRRSQNILNWRTLKKMFSTCISGNRPKLETSKTGNVLNRWFTPSKTKTSKTKRLKQDIKTSCYENDQNRKRLCPETSVTGIHNNIYRNENGYKKNVNVYNSTSFSGINTYISRCENVYIQNSKRL